MKRRFREAKLERRRQRREAVSSVYKLLDDVANQHIVNGLVSDYLEKCEQSRIIAETGLEKVEDSENGRGLE